MYCANCGVELPDGSRFCSSCGTSSDGTEKTKSIVYQPPDVLSGGYIVLIWLSVVIPFGSWILIIVSSVLYYSWKKKFPNKAKSINRHAWIVFILSNIIWLGIIYSCSAAIQ